MVSRRNSRPPRPVIALDGTESQQGRALFLMSALHWCADWLPAVSVHLLDATDEDVLLAADALRWEHGVELHVSDGESQTVMEDVDLYAAAAFQSVDHLRLEEARRAGVPVFLTVQYPDGNALTAPVLYRHAAAFDPKRFAQELGAIVRPWL